MFGVTIMNSINKNALAFFAKLFCGLSITAVAQASEFGYLHAVSDMNKIAINNLYYYILISPTTVNFSTLQHDILLEQSN